MWTRPLPLRLVAFSAAAILLLSSKMWAANPVPFVNQPLLPTSVAPGGPDLRLAVNGTGFTSSSVVNWNGSALATSFVNAGMLLATVPAADTAVAKTASITVSSPAPGGGISNAVPFTVTVPTSSLAFTASTVISGMAPGNIMTADFNNDGRPDLAVLNVGQSDPACYLFPGYNGGTISILLGKGDGTFTSKSTLCAPDTVGNLLNPMLIGDFNGDGKPDVLLTYQLNEFGIDNYGQIFFGNGDGTFTPGQTVTLAEYEIGSAITADFDRNGTLDLAVPFLDDDGVIDIEILLGAGDGTFDSRLVLDPCSVEGGCEKFNGEIAGDFNGDGILDLAAFLTNGGVKIYLGNGDGSFTPAKSQPTIALINATSWITADFDGDGILDLAITDAGSTALIILKGKGNGTFTQVAGEPPLLQSSDFVATADLNGDGKLDLVFAGTNDVVSIFYGNGDGTFTPALNQAMNAPGGIAIADFNGDGRLDLAVGNSNSLTVLLQSSARPGATVTLASGPGTVGQPVSYNALVWGSPTAPTGSVTFKQGSMILGTEPLTNGEATLTTTFQQAGAFPVIAAYSGDGNYAAKNSPPARQVVKYVTTIDPPQMNPDPSAYGQSFSLSTSVSNGTSSNPPTGTVTFWSAPFLLGSAKLVNGHGATTTNVHLPAGAYPITANYNGDAFNSTSESYAYKTINQASTTTTLTSFQSTSLAGHVVTFKATVSSPTTKPVGTVTFSNGNTILGTVNLAGGVANLSTTALPVGTLTITATYGGTDNLMWSSASVVHTVK